MPWQPDIVTIAGTPVVKPSVGAPGLLPIGPGECNGRRCLIEIRLTGSNCASAVVDPPEFNLGPIGTRRVVWRIRSNDAFEFCPALGDGVYIQAQQRREFVELEGTDNEDGDLVDQTPSCFSHFRVKNWNDERAEHKYQYFLQFRLKQDHTKVCKVDPWIKNGR